MHVVGSLTLAVTVGIIQAKIHLVYTVFGFIQISGTNLHQSCHLQQTSHDSESII